MCQCQYLVWQAYQRTYKVKSNHTFQNQDTPLDKCIEDLIVDLNDFEPEEWDGQPAVYKLFWANDLKRICDYKKNKAFWYDVPWNPDDDTPWRFPYTYSGDCIHHMTLQYYCYKAGLKA